MYLSAYSEALGGAGLVELNVNPRHSFPDAIDRVSDGATRSFLQRLRAAHINQYEVLPILIASLALAHTLGASATVLDRAALAYFCITTVYVAVYTSRPAGWKGLVRSGLFSLRLACISFTLGAAVAAARGSPESLLDPLAVVGLQLAVVGTAAGAATAAGTAAGKLVAAATAKGK